MSQHEPSSSSSETRKKTNVNDDETDGELNETLGAQSVASETTESCRSIISNESIYRKRVKQGNKKFLENLLATANFGLALKNEYARKSELSDASSLLLCEIIVVDLINDCDAKATNADFCDITDEIVEIFPNEKRETYFIPPIYKRESISNVSKRARGRLPDMFHNKLRLFRRMSGYTSSHKSRKSLQQEAVSQDVNESLQWLAHNKDFNEIEHHWRKTAKARQEQLRQGDGNVCSYLKKYSVLIDPQRGHTLIEIDFNELFGTALSIYSRWNSFVQEITRAAPPKKSSTIMDQYKSWLDDENTSEHAKEFIQIRLLSSLIAPRASISTKKRGVWKPSSQESQDAMAAHVKVFGDIEQQHRTKMDKMLTFGLPVQPYIIAVGETEDTVDEFYVVCDQVRYRFESPIKALDVCFKTFFAWNIKFPPECEHIWLLIQRGVYGIQTRDDNMKPHISKILQKLDL